MESFAGADLHKRITRLAVLREGQPPSEFRFPKDPMTVDGVLRKLPRGTKIAVEATGSWWWFIEKAGGMGHEVCLSHPKQTKAIVHARLTADCINLNFTEQTLSDDVPPLSSYHTSECTNRRYAKMQRKTP